MAKKLGDKNCTYMTPTEYWIIDRTDRRVISVFVVSEINLENKRCQTKLKVEKKNLSVIGSRIVYILESRLRWETG